MMRSPSGLRGEDALQGDREIDHQEGLHVEMRLAAADIGNRPGAHRSLVLHWSIEKVGCAVTEDESAGYLIVTRVGRSVQDVRVRGNFADRQRVPLLAATLAERVAAAHVDRRAAVPERAG